MGQTKDTLNVDFGDWQLEGELDQDGRLTLHVRDKDQTVPEMSKIVGDGPHEWAARFTTEQLEHKAKLTQTERKFLALNKGDKVLCRRTVRADHLPEGRIYFTAGKSYNVVGKDTMSLILTDDTGSPHQWGVEDMPAHFVRYDKRLDPARYPELKPLYEE